MDIGIYEIRNTINDKIYIGSSKSITRRFWSHKRELRNGIHDNIKLQRAWDKYGADSFQFNKIIICKKEDLMMYEQLCIDGYDVVSKGYNIAPTAGSALGCIMSDEAKQKISIGNTGKIRSKEFIQLMSDARKGIPMSDEVVKNMSIAQQKRWDEMPPEKREDVASKNRGRVHTEEARKIIEMVKSVKAEESLGFIFSNISFISTFEEFKFKVLESQNADLIVVSYLESLKNDSGDFVPRLEVVEWLISHSNVPEYSQEKALIKDGLLFSFNPSAYGQGKVAGDVAFNILVNGQSPLEIGMIIPEFGERSINLKRARMLGLDIPSSILINSEVYENFSYIFTNFLAMISLVNFCFTVSLALSPILSPSSGFNNILLTASAI